jgi:hypothetical protein
LKARAWRNPFQRQWFVLRLPSTGQWRSCGHETEAFEDFYFNVCTSTTQDGQGMDALKALLGAGQGR